MPATQHMLHSQPPTDRLVNAEEFADHPEWGASELIRGKVVPLSVPKFLHGLIVAMITSRMLEYVLKLRLGKVFCNDSGIIIERDPDTVRGPDVGFVSTARIPPKGEFKEYLAVAPDICVEVISPSDRWSEITEKVDMYLGKGVTVVWVIDPDARKAHVYRKGRAKLIIDATGKLDGEEILPGFQLSLHDIFSVVDE